MKKFNTISVRSYMINERSALKDTELRIRTIYEFSLGIFFSFKIYRVQLDDGIHWYIRDQANGKTPARTFIYDLPEVPDLTLCTEEEYFQCSLVLDSSLDIELIRAVQEYHNNVVQDNYDYYHGSDFEQTIDITKDIIGIQNENIRFND